jgi:hypothetical protein
MFFYRAPWSVVYIPCSDKGGRGAGRRGGMVELVAKHDFTVALWVRLPVFILDLFLVVTAYNNPDVTHSVCSLYRSGNHNHERALGSEDRPLVGLSVIASYLVNRPLFYKDTMKFSLLTLATVAASASAFTAAVS